MSAEARGREEGNSEAPGAFALPNDAVRGLSRLLWSMEKAELASPWVRFGTPQYTSISFIGRLLGTRGVSDAI